VLKIQLQWQSYFNSVEFIWWSCMYTQIEFILSNREFIPKNRICCVEKTTTATTDSNKC